MTDTKKRLFAREATGLVRELGFLDQLIMSISTMNPLGAFVLTTLGISFFFPGSNLLLVFLIASIPAFAFVAMYGILGAAMPRSGGDYVWTGRILGPRIATVMAVLFLFGQIAAFQSSVAWGVVSWILAPGLLAFGLTTGNPGIASEATFVTQPVIGFAIGVVFLALIILVSVFGVGVFKKVNKFAFAVYFLMIVVFIITMLSVSQSSLQASFDRAMSSYSLTYSSVLSTVQKNPQLATFSLFSTVAAAPFFGFINYSGFNFFTYAGGELKATTKNVQRALFTAVVIVIVILVILSEVTFGVMGDSFVAGVSYLSNTGGFGSLTVSPTVAFLLSLAVHPWLGLAITFGLLVSQFLVALQTTVLFSRMVFAMSFDRILPSRFAKVSDRFHSPYIAVLTVGTLSILILTLFWYGPGLLTGFLNSAIAVNLAYTIPGIAAFLFPFVRKDLYARVVKPLPGWLSREIAGWPVVSIAGLCVVLIWSFATLVELVPLSTYGYLGSSIGLALVFVFASIVVGLVLFETARYYYRRRDGIDILLTSREIPPE